MNEYIVRSEIVIKKHKGPFCRECTAAGRLSHWGLWAAETRPETLPRVTKQLTALAGSLLFFVCSSLEHAPRNEFSFLYHFAVFDTENLFQQQKHELPPCTELESLGPSQLAAGEEGSLTPGRFPCGADTKPVTD